MQHAITLLGIVGLSHGCLGITEQIASLSVVHLCQKLATTYSLSLTHQDALNDTHTCKAYGCSLTLFDNTYIGLGIVHHTWRHNLSLHSHRSFALLLLLLSTTAYQSSRQ